MVQCLGTGLIVMLLEKTISTLIDRRVTQYDPYVVDAFVEVLEDDTEIQQLYA
jgi:response regulator RpfG family c-di-GMP phosphodiesterase